MCKWLTNLYLHPRYFLWVSSKPCPTLRLSIASHSYYVQHKFMVFALVPHVPCLQPCPFQCSFSQWMALSPIQVCKPELWSVILGPHVTDTPIDAYRGPDSGCHSCALHCLHFLYTCDLYPLRLQVPGELRVYLSHIMPGCTCSILILSHS